MKKRSNLYERGEASGRMCRSVSGKLGFGRFNRIKDGTGTKYHQTKREVIDRRTLMQRETRHSFQKKRGVHVWTEWGAKGYLGGRNKDWNSKNKRRRQVSNIGRGETYSGRKEIFHDDHSALQQKCKVRWAKRNPRINTTVPKGKQGV